MIGKMKENQKAGYVAPQLLLGKSEPNNILNIFFNRTTGQGIREATALVKSLLARSSKMKLMGRVFYYDQSRISNRD